jgi:hypothetical protein
MIRAYGRGGTPMEGASGREGEREGEGRERNRNTMRECITKLTNCPVKMIIGCPWPATQWRKKCAHSRKAIGMA